MIPGGPYIIGSALKESDSKSVQWATRQNVLLKGIDKWNYRVN